VFTIEVRPRPRSEFRPSFIEKGHSEKQRRIRNNQPPFNYARFDEMCSDLKEGEQVSRSAAARPLPQKKKPKPFLVESSSTSDNHRPPSYQGLSNDHRSYALVAFFIAVITLNLSCLVDDGYQRWSRNFLPRMVWASFSGGAVILPHSC
jgi:hypothetical protein